MGVFPEGALKEKIRCFGLPAQRLVSL